MYTRGFRKSYIGDPGQKFMFVSANSNSTEIMAKLAKKQTIDVPMFDVSSRRISIIAGTIVEIKYK